MDFVVLQGARGASTSHTTNGRTGANFRQFRRMRDRVGGSCRFKWQESCFFFLILKKVKSTRHPC